MDSGLIGSIREKFPDHTLAVELTDMCNLRCPLCGTGSGFNKRATGMMNLARYKNFMEECAPLFDKVRFIGSGEPMMHPRFLEFVRFTAKKKKKFTSCCTNGTLIKDPGAIVKAGLREIHIDVDGLTGEQHEKYRAGSSLESVIKGIKGLVRAKQNLHSFYPQIYVDTLISRHNENDYENFIKMADSLSANAIRFTGIQDVLFQTEDWYPTKEKFKHAKRAPGYKCCFKNTVTGILAWNGELLLCCMTPHHDNPVIKLDAFRENNLLEKMDSEKFYESTKLAGSYDFCKGCFPNIYSSYNETIAFERPKPLGYYLATYMRRPAALPKAILRKTAKWMKK